MSAIRKRLAGLGPGFFLLALVPMLDACTGSNELPESTSRRFSVEETEAGLQAVNHGEPLYAGEPIITLDLAIGDESGTDEYTFSYVSQVRTDGHGRIYVNTNPVNVYDRDGVFLRSLGGEGDGPGEMRFSGSVTAWPDGTLDIVGIDGRWVRWDSDGALEFDRRPRDFMASMNTNRLITPGGLISYSYRNPWSIAGSDTTTAYWLFKCEGDLSPTSVGASFGKGRPNSVWNQSFEGHRLGSMLPFSTELITAITGRGGFAIAQCDSSFVNLYDVAFHHELTVRWETDRVPLTEEDIIIHHNLREEHFIGQKDAQWRERTDRMLRFLLSQEYPDTKPVLQDVLIGLDGRIWVEKWGNRDLVWMVGQDRIHDYWVFTAEGELEFECNMPFEVQASTSEYLFEAFSDGENTPQVRRYTWRIRK